MTIILNEETETLILVDYDDIFEMLTEEEEEMLRQPAKPRLPANPLFADITILDDEILF